MFELVRRLSTLTRHSRSFQCKIDNLCIPPKRGSQCSVSGKMYEKSIYMVLNKCYIDGSPFNVQHAGGSSHDMDLICIFNGSRMGIEVKKSRAPDWIQCCIHFNHDLNTWTCSPKSTLPEGIITMFTSMITDKCIFNNHNPPSDITHSEWKRLKSSTTTWNDMYFDIDPLTISMMYSFKGCQYIQLSEHGLYHTGCDPCGFDVPLFAVKSKARVRVKIHSSNIYGVCRLSTTISCQPILRDLVTSKYSLNNPYSLPPRLVSRIH